MTMFYSVQIPEMAFSPEHKTRNNHEYNQKKTRVCVCVCVCVWHWRILNWTL